MAIREPRAQARITSSFSSLSLQDIGLAPEGAGEGAHLVGDNCVGRRRCDPLRGLRLLANCLGHFHEGTNRAASLWFLHE
ncbi:hypothetical protein [Bradyrhizobium elkanii]|uniref:hypothetical protein n=1 Tax=Bradyrhizobium elkanii TaxID=29448 RepID=UPI002FF002F7